jgi:hypothetical protein
MTQELVNLFATNREGQVPAAGNASRAAAFSVLVTRQEIAMQEFRKSALQSAFLAATAATLFTGTALAQTTIVTQEPVQSRTVVTTEPLQLTPVQRQTVYRTIVRDRVAAPPQAAVEYRVGTRIPAETQLYAVPQEVAVEVPAVRSYKYMVVNGQVLLVDPATSQVVAELDD